MSVGQNIKRLRKNNSMTQGELAKRLNISNKTVCSWEVDRTEPSMGMVEKMSKIFCCTKAEIISGSAEVPEYDPIMAEAVLLLGRISKEQKLAVLSLLRSFVD